MKTAKQYHPRDKARYDCLTCPLRRQAEWTGATNEEMCRVRDTRTIQRYQRGQFLYIQGQPSKGVFCIREGSLVVMKDVPGGSPLPLRLVHSGQTIGFRNYMNHGVATTTAKALEPCVVCQVNPDLFKGLVKKNPALNRNFLNRLAKDLDEAELALVELAALPVRSRLARLLLSIMKHHAVQESGDGVSLETSMTWRDMSELIYTRPETLARTIHAMEEEGLLSHKGHSIHIPKVASLRAEGGVA